MTYGMPKLPCETSVVKMVPCDLAQVVRVHLRSFPGYFLSELGPRFLRILYKAISDDPSGIVLVHRRFGRVAAVVAGTVEPVGLYSRLLRRAWYRFALGCLLPALCRPNIIPRLLNAFRRASEQPGESRSALIMSIAVDPDIQASGVGTALVRTFIDQCRPRGVTSVYLTTDRLQNERANRFYSQLGFVVSRIVTSRQGRAMNELRLHIDAG